MTSVRPQLPIGIIAMSMVTALLGTGCSPSTDVEPSLRASGIDAPVNESMPGPSGDAQRAIDRRPANPRGRHPAALGTASMRSSPLYLESEERMILDTGISSDAARELLGSSMSLEKAADRMDRDAASRPEAQDLTAHYRASLLRAIGENGTLERLSCGLSICIGSIRAGTVADHEAWGERFSSDPSSRTYSFTQAFENLGASHQTRFIFSTDSALNAITGN